jgi:hypothetical protein
MCMSCQLSVELVLAVDESLRSFHWEAQQGFQRPLKGLLMALREVHMENVLYSAR